MDVANYLSELLGQTGEVNVPGLGYFVQTRIEGYYNEHDATFYPPKNRVQFSNQSVGNDDDMLAQYIAVKKNISLASSRYFTEKYISNLKQEATLKDIPLGDLGFLQVQGNEVIFKPAPVMNDDPAVFGYAPVRLKKLEGSTIVSQLEEYNQRPKVISAPMPEPAQLPAPEPVYELPPAREVTYEEPVSRIIREETPPVIRQNIPQPVVSQPRPPVYTPPPVVTEEDNQEEFVFHGKTYDPERRSFKWLWITLLVIVVVAILGVAAIYKFKPSLFHHIRSEPIIPVKLKTPLRTDSSEAARNDSLKKDSLMKISGGKDTASLKPSAVDNTSVHFELIANKEPTLTEAKHDVDEYKKQNINAYIINGMAGPLVKVSVGNFTSKADAINKEDELKKTNKIPLDSYIEPVNPKQ